MSLTPAPPSPQPVPQRWYARAHEVWRPTFRYCLRVEVHAYAFSVAANVLLAFFPFLLVIASLCKFVFHWPEAATAIQLALLDFFPGRMGEFIGGQLSFNVAYVRPFEAFSLFMLLFTANGVFGPLEVALNRIWGVTKDRSLLRNQMVGLGLIFLCGGLALLSLVLTGMNHQVLDALLPAVPKWVSLILFKVAALPTTILGLWFMYWLLPNRRIAPVKVLPVAIQVGLILEFLKYINLLVYPYFRAKLNREYGPFAYSVTILLSSFIVAMLILATAERSARRARSGMLEA